MKRLSKILMLFFIILIVPSFAQENCYTYLKDNKDWESQTNASHSVEIFLLGTFHFKQKFVVPQVEKQLLDFKPEAIFVEEVSPDASYKETYLNRLYSYYGVNVYSAKIDSLAEFMKINKSDVAGNINKSYQILRENPGALADRVNLINYLFIAKDDANANYQWHLLNSHLNSNQAQLTPIMDQKLTPFHRRLKFSMRETHYLTIPLAEKLNLQKIHYMDDQLMRFENDSLLSITVRKVMPKLMLRFWKIPYMLKMQKLDQQGPQTNDEALAHFKILNERKTILNMAKLHDQYFNNKKIPESKKWNEHFRERNQNMVDQIMKGLSDSKAKKALVIVGASHVPYFIWFIKTQYPQAKLRFLELKERYISS
jgi:hypothetical protein